MKVRFRKEYTELKDKRIAYELVDDTLAVLWEDNRQVVLEEYFNTKLLGLIPTYKMEVTEDETDIPAIDILVSVTNK